MLIGERLDLLDSCGAWQESEGSKNMVASATSRLVATAVGVVLLVSLAVGCSPPAASESATTGNVSEPATETGAEVSEEPKIKHDYVEEIQDCADMSPEEFEALPSRSRLRYAQYLTDKTVTRDALSYSKAYENHPYQLVPVSASREDDGQAILDQYVYRLQIAFLQFTGVNPQIGSADPGNPKAYILVSETQKVLASAYYEVCADAVTDYSGWKTSASEGELWARVDPYSATSVSELTTGIDASGASVEYKDVVFDRRLKEYGDEGLTASEWQTLTARFVYQEFTSHDGTPQSTWIMESVVPSSAELSWVSRLK